ncbi:hypothetical protein HNP67_001325 [Borreliella californiensis]|uniref:Uncharacterized protein n=1 Tax=Borreliella californiensis TaxID=373543 RepID=A0A7X0DRZ1_9SPIR|nr:hypothetical protein [Borreliella californiensis]MBB6213830.1 hypothetical protein [Borreliella californiensis]
MNNQKFHKPPIVYMMVWALLKLVFVLICHFKKTLVLFASKLSRFLILFTIFLMHLNSESKIKI